MNELELTRRSIVIAEEAAHWVVALADADEQTRKAFAAWLRLSPEHIREFLAVAGIWGTLPDISSRPAAEELARLAAAQPNVVAMPGVPRNASKNTPAPASSRRRWMGRAAAVLVAAAAGAIFLILRPGEDPNLYTTGTGQQSSVTLPDGSLVTLNTRSTVRLAYSEEYRDLHLAEGEALFDVKKDATRPFRVMTGHAVIQAVGTQFNVRKDADEITVTVVEGAVDVTSSAPGATADALVDGLPATSGSPTSVRVKTGQQAQVKSGLVQAAMAATAVEGTMAWRQRRLVFDAVPLPEVIEEFNRYNDPPAVIDDKRLESMPISGVFRSNDRDSFLQFLSQMQLAESSTGPDGAIVLKGMPGDESIQ